MRIELKRDQELIFKKFEVNYHSINFLPFMSCSFTYKDQRTFVTFHFACPMTQKSLNFVKERGTY
jgi:hypothetical protein